MRYSKILIALALVTAFAGSASATTTSCDQLTFGSNSDNPLLSGEILSCSFTSDFSTDEINIDIPSSELSDDYANGEVQNSLGVKVTEQENYARYGFRDTGLRDGYKFEYAEERVDIGCLDSAEEVQAKTVEAIGDDAVDLGNLDYYGDKKIGFGNCYSIVGYIERGEKLASFGEISSSPNLVFETEFTVDNGERTYTRTISNSEIGQGSSTTIADGQAGIYWTGNKRGGEVAPSPTDEMIAHNNDWEESNGFRVVNRNDYQVWRSDISSLYDSVKSRMQGELYSDEAVTSNINAKLEEAVSPHSSSEFTDSRFRGSDMESGSMELDMSQLAFPSFQIDFAVCQYLETESDCGDFISIKQNVGIPEISDVSSSKFKEMGSGEIDVTYENVGSARGSFEASVEQCGSGFSISDNSQRSVLQAGESTTASFQISASSQSFQEKELTSSCDVSVTEINSQRSDSASVDVTAVQQNECTPGDQFVKVKENSQGNTYDTVQECGDQGLQTEQILKCTTDEQAIEKDNTWQCEAQGNDVNVWEIEGEAGSKQCVKHTYQVQNIPNSAYLEKSSCQDQLSGGQVCLVDTNVVGQSVEIGCISEGLWNKMKFVILLAGGLLGGGAGYMVGSYVDGERQVRGRNKYMTRRSVSRVEKSRNTSISTEQIAGAVVGGLIGIAIGWYLGIIGTFALIGLLFAVKYVIPGY